MLSLFSNDNTGPAPKKNKKSESFNLDSFISSVLPTREEEPKPENNNENIKYDYNERIEQIPSKSVMKIFDQVRKSGPHNVLPKELKKVSRKLSKSINHILLNSSEPDFPRSRVKESFKVEKKPRNSQPKTKPPGSTPNGSRKGSMSSQNNDFQNNHLIMKPYFDRENLKHSLREEETRTLVKKRKDSDRLEKVNKSTTTIKKKDDGNYDPLDFVPAPKKIVKLEKEKKVILKESEGQYEQYDPLSVIAPIRKASGDQKTAKKEGLDILGKRPNGNWLECKYETDIVKKPKLVTLKKQ